MNGIIYVLTNKVTFKAYVGQTRNRLTSRFSQHRRRAEDGCKLPLYNAIRRHGWKTFDCTVVESGIDNQDALNGLEQSWISDLKSNERNIGYNVDNGGTGEGKLSPQHIKALNGPKKGVPLSEEHRRKISLGLKGKPTWNKGIKMPEEYCQKLSVARKGKTFKTDGLTKWQRYRLKDLEAYRKRKREYAKTPVEREKRRLRNKAWRDRQKLLKITSTER